MRLAPVAPAAWVAGSGPVLRGPAVVEAIYITSGAGPTSTHRVMPMAFVGSVPLQTGADLSYLLLAGMPLLAVAEDNVARRDLGDVGIGRWGYVFWPRAVVPWVSWAPGLVGGQPGVVEAWLEFAEFSIRYLGV